MIIPILKELVSNPKSEIRNPKLLVVGDGPYKEKLLEEIKDNNLENYIEIVGAVPNKEMADYYNRADVLIMPSMEEGFPRVLLEAMASGVPYVATDVGAVREISPEIAQRFLVNPGNPEKFAQKIEILVSDEKIYEQFKKEELEKIKEYSLGKILDKFVELFL
jgi:glycosyltransferase involved in cell wall biosynthesis